MKRAKGQCEQDLRAFIAANPGVGPSEAARQLKMSSSNVHKYWKRLKAETSPIVPIVKAVSVREIVPDIHRRFVLDTAFLQLKALERTLLELKGAFN